jgi:ubiquinone/menaquinone biosynthesis C-methylase UbiE
MEFNNEEFVKLVNKVLQDKESFHYDILNGEIWNFHEQLRIKRDVKTILEVTNKPPQRLKVLVIGSGTGNPSLKFLYLGCEVTAFDISQKMLEILQSKVPDTLRKS